MPATVDGIAISNRIDASTERKLHAKVVDNVLNAPTLGSRIVSKGVAFQGTPQSFSLKVTNASTFEWFVGLETLSSAADDNVIILNYNHAAGTQPKVGIMLESFANAGAAGTIPLDAFKYQEAGAEAIDALATALYGTGSGNAPLGLQAIVDDGTNAGTIGGASRTTYTALNATYTSSAGTMTLAKLATLDSAASKGSEVGAMPNLNATTFTIWDLYETLLEPTTVSNYNSNGFPMLSIRGENVVPNAQRGGAAGFMVLFHRGKAVLKDKYCTSGVWYKLNEKSSGWYGRTIVPDEYRGTLTKVDLGDQSAYESVAADEAVSTFNGFFYQTPRMMEDQAGTIARFYIIGQYCTWNPRMNGQLNAITGV